MDPQLQWLFSEPILTERLYGESHPGQASYVWHVQTQTQDVIVRSSRLRDSKEDCFWQGARQLFGVIPTNIQHMPSIHTVLRQHLSIPVPAVHRVAYLDHVPYLLVEKMPGTALHAFQDLSLQATEAFGSSLARLHQEGKQSFFGSLHDPHHQHPAHQFGNRLASTMTAIVARHFADHTLIKEHLSKMRERAQDLTVSETSPILLDMDATQYLADEYRNISALVDTEVYVLGPRELELVALEYLLDTSYANAFYEGYTRVCKFPSLSKVRPLYRYFCRLIEIQGPVDFYTWMNAPQRFPDEKTLTAE